jgi:hypothetical protein
MAKYEIHFENPRTGQKRDAPVGFSWTTLFWGPIPMIYRGNWKWAAIIIIAGIVTFGISNIAFAFFINKSHIRDLINDGFEGKAAGGVSLAQATIDTGIRFTQ